MNGTLVSFRPSGQLYKAPSPRREDRWSDVLVAHRRRFTVATALVLLASAAFHGALVATAFLDRTAPHARPSQEISVEVVPEMPKPPEAAKSQGSGKQESGKQESAAKQDPAKQASVAKQVIPAEQPPPPQPTPPQQAATHPEPPPALKPALPPPPIPPTPPAVPPKDPSSKAMQDELAELRAEQAALAAEQAAPPKPAPPAGFGPLPDSFQAVALPSEAGEEGEVVGYTAVVFSQLAKAKEIGGKMGQPGTAAVHFTIDLKGALTGVEIVHSSGIKQLDVEALDIVHRAAPFPVPPQGAQRDFSANVSFIAGEGR